MAFPHGESPAAALPVCWSFCCCCQVAKLLTSKQWRYCITHKHGTVMHLDPLPAAPRQSQLPLSQNSSDKSQGHCRT